MSHRESTLSQSEPALPHCESVAQARRLASQGELAAAAEACRRILMTAPHDVAATAQLAKLARKAGELDAAEHLLRHALGAIAGPQTAELWLQLGLTLRAANRLREAVAAYHEAAMADPGLTAAWINLAGVYCELQHWPNAEAMARRALQLAPESAEALVNLAEARHNLGDLADQTACLEQAVRLKPDWPLAHWNLSLALLLQGDYQRGWEHFEWRERAGRVTLDPYAAPRWNGARWPAPRC